MLKLNILDAERNEKCVAFKKMCFFFFFVCLYTFIQVEGVEQELWSFG